MRIAPIRVTLPLSRVNQIESTSPAPRSSAITHPTPPEARQPPLPFWFPVLMSKSPPVRSKLETCRVSVSALRYGNRSNRRKVSQPTALSPIRWTTGSAGAAPAAAILAIATSRNANIAATARPADQRLAVARHRCRSGPAPSVPRLSPPSCVKPSRMDTSTFIDRLNEDLGTEYQSIVQYIQHIATIKGPEYHAITEELANHLAQELEP